MHGTDSSFDRLLRRQGAQVLLDRSRIARRVQELADEIARSLGDSEVTILAVLTGSLIFLADLVRHLPLPMHIGLVGVSSYPGRAVRSRGPELTLPAQAKLVGKNVLIVDDILDSGRTLALLQRQVLETQARSLRTCVLLEKKRPDVPDRPRADWVGFRIEDRFVVGYGLDYDNLYRNLPDICVLEAVDGRAKEQG